MCEIRKEPHIIKRQPSVTDKDRGTLLTINNKNHILLKKKTKKTLVCLVSIKLWIQYILYLKGE